MTTPRNQKYFDAMPDNLRKLGGYKTDFVLAVKWGGIVDDAAGAFHGWDASVLDLTADAWATGNLHWVIIAEPAADLNNTGSMKTQSHALGKFLDGSSRFHVFMEQPAAWNDDLAHFNRLVQHHVVGQLAAPLKFWYSANGTQPEVKGVNGAGATTATLEADWLLPGTPVYPGGV